MKDRGFVKSLIERAAAAKCSALVLTIDLQVLGQRHCDRQNGLSVPPAIRLKNVINIATKPGWACGMLRGKRKTFGNLAGYTPSDANVASLASWISTQFDPALSWKDVEWVRSLWPGKLIIKGVLDVEDARIAAKTGADAIVVSNHGGRQLDGAPSSISALPKVADAVGAEIEIMFDGGIRSGQDLMRALALGARSCLIGRSYIFGLGAGGQAGVTRAIEIIRERARRDDGAVRRQPGARHRPPRDRADVMLPAWLHGLEPPTTSRTDRNGVPSDETPRPRPSDFDRAASAARARQFNGRTVADTTRALVLRETTYKPVFYIPREDADMTAFERTSHSTHCPYKGDASYYSIRVGDKLAENAIWSYEQPFPGDGRDFRTAGVLSEPRRRDRRGLSAFPSASAHEKAHHGPSVPPPAQKRRGTWNCPQQAAFPPMIQRATTGQEETHASSRGHERRRADCKSEPDDPRGGDPDGEDRRRHSAGRR